VSVARDLNLRAVALATALVYVSPRLIDWLAVPHFRATPVGSETFASQVLTGIFWLFVVWMLVGPFIAGYFVASLGKRAPILHGLVLGIIGSLVWSLGVPFGPALFEVVRVTLLVGLAVAGAWVWKYRFAGASVAR
jgi:MFS family permease